MNSYKWSQELEDDLALLVKDWLKQNGHSQADLKDRLEASSTRMPAIIEALKKEYYLGGMQKIALRLCEIENSWTIKNKMQPAQDKDQDPFGQLDLSLDEIREHCDSETDH